jgi:hypothetical protein
MTEKEVDPYYEKKAKDVFNLLHDKGFFDDRVAHESFQVVIDYFAYILQSTADMASFCATVKNAKFRDMGAREKAVIPGIRQETRENFLKKINNELSVEIGNMREALVPFAKVSIDQTDFTDNYGPGMDLDLTIRSDWLIDAEKVLYPNRFIDKPEEDE